MKQAAIETVQDLPLPWSMDASEGIQIHDQRGYYEQTFRPTLLPYETLKLWLV